MSSHEEFKITYTMTPRDYAVMTAAITRRPLSKNLFTLVLWLLSVWCLMFIFTGIYNPVAMVQRVASNTVATLLVAALTLFALAVTIGNEWIVRGLSYLHYGKLVSADATITMTMNETGIQSSSSVASSLVPWATVKSVMREGDHMIAPISAREALIMPRRGFRSGEDFDAAIRYATDRVLNSRPNGARSPE